MNEPIRFYFDFVSTYSYFAVHRIEAVAARHRRELDWRVVSLPHVFALAGGTSPLDQPLKLAHNRADAKRLAAMLGMRYTEPKIRPIDARLARTAFYHFKARDPARAAAFARSVMDRAFGAGEPIATADDLARASGFTPAEIEAAAADESARAALMAMRDTALADGMFGAPFAVVDGERFWGSDRVIEHLDWWLGRAHR